MMELPELFTPAELADIIAPDINLTGYRIQCQQSGGTKIFTMCDTEYPYQPRFLLIINNKRISIAEHDHNDCNSQTELIRITKDDCCPDSFHVSNCTKSKTHTILNLIDKIKKAIDEKVMKNRIETNIRNEITITDDDIISIISDTTGIRNFTTFEIPCGNYKEIFIEDRNYPLAHVRYGFSRLDNIIQFIRRTVTFEAGAFENTDILVRLDTSNGTVERLGITSIAFGIAHRLEEFIKNNNNKENIKEEKNMSEIRKDEYENNGVTYGISKIGEAVERWLAKRDIKPCKKSKDPSIYTWQLYDGRLILSLQKFAHGFVISQTNCNYSGMRSNLVKITPPFRVDIITDEINSSLEDLVYEIKEIPNIQETKKQTKRKKADDLIPKGPAPSILVKNITFNTVRGTTTVVFDDNTKTMTTTTSGEEFNPEIGLAMCIAKKLYGSRSNFKRVVQLAMTKSEKGNKKRALKEKKKAEKVEALKEHIKAQNESYME